MKKYFLFVLGFVTIYPNLAFNQTVWKKYFNPPGTRSYARTLCEAYDGGYLIGGNYKVTGILDKAWLVKSDINGDLLYEKKLFAPENMAWISCMSTTSDGGYIVGGGYTTSTPVWLSYVAKFNPCGEIEWCTTVEPPAPLHGAYFYGGIHELPDGCYIGHRYLKIYSFDHDRQDLVKFNHDGSIQWINAYGHCTTGEWESDIGYWMMVTSDTGFLVSGESYYRVEPNKMSIRPMWYKVSNDGELLWIRHWVTGYLYDSGEARRTMESANGYSYFTSGKFGSPKQKPTLFKLSTLGDTLFRQRIWDDSLSYSGLAHEIHLYNDTSMLIATQYGLTSSDNWWSVNIIDTLGNIRDQINEEEDFIIVRLELTFDGKVIAQGVTDIGNSTHPEMFGLYKFNSDLEFDSIYTVPRVYDSLCPHPIISDTIILPDHCTTVSIPEIAFTAQLQQLKIFPNPCKDFITVEIPGYSVSFNNYGTLNEQRLRPLKGNVTFCIYNTQGKKITQIEASANSKNLAVDISQWNSGIYFIELLHESDRIATGKFIKY